MMPWLFTEYDAARNFHVLHNHFSIPRVTSYSVKGRANILTTDMLAKMVCLRLGVTRSQVIEQDVYL